MIVAYMTDADMLPSERGVQASGAILSPIRSDPFSTARRLAAEDRPNRSGGELLHGPDCRTKLGGGRRCGDELGSALRIRHHQGP